MPYLEDIKYDRGDTIAAIRDYYDFLSVMYLDPSTIVTPPPDGWAHITSTNLSCLGKTDQVIQLLRHLPYIKDYGDSASYAAPYCTFANWESDTQALLRGRTNAEGLRMCSEPISYIQDVPAHVIGLASGGRDNETILLDTELGIVIWYECRGEIEESTTVELVLDDPYDYAPENEAEWRGDSKAWAVADFFEMLKEQFRQLHFLPIRQTQVKSVYANFMDKEEIVRVLRDVYFSHGWPDPELYRKDECLAALKAIFEKRKWLCV